MEAGVSWADRTPSDWLASNGKWYPASKYPRGWDRTALPPAPGHGGVGSILGKFIESAAAPGRVAPAATPAPADGQPPRTPRPQQQQRPKSTVPPRPSKASRSSGQSGFSVAKSGRQVADATVTKQRTYSPKVGAGTPPPPKLPPTTSTSPGRVRNDPQDGVAPPPPPNPNPVDFAPVKSAPPGSDEVTLQSAAGDLGRLFGSAKKRIEDAINAPIETDE